MRPGLILVNNAEFIQIYEEEINKVMIKNSKSEGADFLPIQPIERKKEMFLSDFQTVGFWVLKNATSIADIETPEGGFASFPSGIAFT